MAAAFFSSGGAMTGVQILLSVPSTLLLMLCIVVITLLSIRWWGLESVFNTGSADARGWAWLVASGMNAGICMRLCKEYHHPVTNFWLSLSLVWIISFLLFVFSMYAVALFCRRRIASSGRTHDGF
jgi:hypothetical protein